MIKRCAIYTRKSTEEGLDQAFNSLDAQRESCEAYIASQKGEGWRLVKTRFDDGGLSGGTLERPAMQALLSDIDAGRIDIIVVYKVDRLTRSLADFAKLVERFDAKDVSFVSVTQAFNTSTSMGRLTLNVLLSFAQFEREVTAERIRDKIAASRKKGIWTGGNPPLGYDNVDKKLVMNKAEAEIVRQIYALYLDTGCINAIMRGGKENGWTTKPRANGRGGKLLSPGPLYHILRNPVYAGLMRGGKELYPSEHEAIVDREIWAAVQKKRRSRTQWTGKVTSKTSPLAGKIYAGGVRLTPSHARKGGVRYRYYITDIKALDIDEPTEILRLRADELEHAVVAALNAWIGNVSSAARDLLEPGAPARIVETAQREIDDANAFDLTDAPTASIRRWAACIDRIDIGRDSMTITIDPRMLVRTPQADDYVKRSFNLTAPMTMQRRGQERRLVLGDIDVRRPADPTIVSLVERAHRWRARWFEDDSLDLLAIAKEDGVDKSGASKQIRLAFLAPDIIRALTDGAAPVHLNAEQLRRIDDLPASWAAQRKLLGFA